MSVVRKILKLEKPEKSNLILRGVDNLPIRIEAILPLKIKWMNEFTLLKEVEVIK